MPTDTYPTPDAAHAVLDAALAHVPFDGWSDTTLRAAIADSGVTPALAHALFPRGGIDLAVAYHRRGDQRMLDRLTETSLIDQRFRDRIATAIRLRLEVIEDRELVRRGSTLFALPQHAAEGAKLIWGTADAIWTALGDTSQDFNWYSKRTTLSAVYGTTVLYWLGDDSPDHQATREFLNRRIDDVMKIEKAKAGLKDNALARSLLSGPARLFRGLRKPHFPDDLPGQMMSRFGQEKGPK